ncbi:uncharacterized protein [Gossypium hirsutum]|uniref:Uncharacterized protein n=1 Tax=Gossypium hirsutum TaxID=3635 RepID=A0ABM3BM84_GOSHI|nr:uncharacterized protein LOC121229063 [Gossypium hirsutum]
MTVKESPSITRFLNPSFSATTTIFKQALTSTVVASATYVFGIYPCFVTPSSPFHREYPLQRVGWTEFWKFAPLQKAVITHRFSRPWDSSFIPDVDRLSVPHSPSHSMVQQFPCTPYTSPSK